MRGITAVVGLALLIVSCRAAAQTPQPDEGSSRAQQHSGRASTASAPATAEPLPTRPEFEPPPMPAFMLQPPRAPLTLEEMRRQADEAAQRARRSAERPGNAGSAQPAAPAR
jgi:hypothetical protein